MRLSEALTISRKAPAAAAPEFSVFLACGFTPLHLETFLRAHLQLALPEHRIAIETGLYGDFRGTQSRLREANPDCGVIVLEWQDLDARLGLRSLGGWRQSEFTEILDHVRSHLAWIEGTIEAVASRFPLAISLPTLPIPPLQRMVPAWSAGALDLRLQEIVSSFAVAAARNPHVRIVSAGWLDRISPAATRFDAKSELMDGFPYTVPHASALGEGLARLIQSPQPKKGLITDLDNTLWKGILGEIGCVNVSWELDQKSHMHAAYQELLRSLAETGVLIAVASKNDPALVEEAFGRRDLILKKDAIFPFEVHWNPKSESVSRILDAWNIGAESVVFVDDSAAELAEVKAAHPAIECLLFPKAQQEVYDLLGALRNLFAKPAVTEEDKIRLDSLRSSHGMRQESGRSGTNPDEFLEHAGSILEVSFAKDPVDPRVLELLNKTNQFNLNGRRYTEAGLRRLLADPGSFLLKAAYEDRFGRLGTIALVLCSIHERTIHVDSWVMSCRAFSRRIEHACLDHLFRRFAVDEMVFDFQATERNKPLQAFFAEFLGGPPESPFHLSKDLFREKCARLFHRIEDEVYG
jgi:FkbH-like protein